MQKTEKRIHGVEYGTELAGGYPPLKTEGSNNPNRFNGLEGGR
jgi:hypothetical protein